MVGQRLANAKENNRFDSDDEGAGMSVEDISEDDLEDQVGDESSVKRKSARFPKFFTPILKINPYTKNRLPEVYALYS